MAGRRRHTVSVTTGPRRHAATLITGPWRRAAVALAGVAALAGAVAPAGTASSRPSLTPRHGKAFVPSVGDWEGTVNGFPASFALLYDPSRKGASYQSDDLVVLRPGGCPPASARYAEDVIVAGHPPAVSRAGSLGLSRFGYDGSLTGQRSAVLAARYRVRSGAGACAGKLVWHLHPARRRPVDDGVWKIRFADGESGSFRIQAGGRLATSIRIPSELTRCSGVSGDVDLFIAPDASARLFRPEVHVSMRFARRRASGTMNEGGGGCAGGRFRFSAALQHSGD